MQLKKLAQVLNHNGLPLDAQTIQVIENGNKLSYQHTPVEKILRSITLKDNPVLDEFISNPTFARMVTHWLRLLAHQQNQINRNKSQLIRYASLVVRRRISFYFRDNEFIHFGALMDDMDFQIQQLRENKKVHSSTYRLPDPRITKILNLGIDPSLSTLTQLREALVKLHKGINLAEKYSPVELDAAEDLKERFRLKWKGGGKSLPPNQPAKPMSFRRMPSAAFIASSQMNQALSLQSLPLPVAIGMVRLTREIILSKKLRQESPFYLAVLLIRLLEVYYGLHPRKIAHLGWKKDGFVGRIYPDRLRIELASNPLMALDEITSTQSVDWPLAPEIEILARHLRQQHQSFATFTELLRGLGEQRLNFAQNYLDGLRKINLHKLGALETPVTGGHHVFSYSALKNGMNVVQAGLYSASIPGGTRGEMAYFSGDHAKMCLELIQIHQMIAADSGVSITQRIKGNLSGGPNYVGSPSVDYDEYCDRLIQSLDSHPNDLNYGLTALVGLLRGLGLRKSNHHPNPLGLIVRVGNVLTLEFSDKLVSGQPRYRHIPLPSFLIEFFAAIAQPLGVGTELAYSGGKGSTIYSELPDTKKKELWKAVNQEGIYNAGRTAFYNLLWRKGVGQKPRNMLMAHGFSGVQPITITEMFAHTQMIESNATQLIPILERTHLPQLCKKIQNNLLSNCSRPLTINPPPNAHHNPGLDQQGEEIEFLTEHLIAPPTQDQILMIQEIEQGFKQSKVTGTTQSIMVSALIEFGFPFDHWQTMESYYRHNDILIETQTQTTWFMVPTMDTDRGGIGRYPLKIGDKNHSSVLLESLKKRFDIYCRKRPKSETARLSPQEKLERFAARKIFDHKKMPQAAAEKILCRHSRRFRALSPAEKSQFLKIYSQWKAQSEINGPMRHVLHEAWLPVNQAHPHDVIRQVTGQRVVHLVNLAGQPVTLVSPTSNVQARLRLLNILNLTEKKRAGRPPRPVISDYDEIIHFKAADWFELFVKAGYEYNPDGISQILDEIREKAARKITNTVFARGQLLKSNHWSTRKMVAEICQLYLKKNLANSKPYRVLNDQQMADVFQKIKQYVFNSSRHGRRKDLAEEYHFALLLAGCCGLRAGEMIRLKPADLINLGGKKFLHIARGKTRNARRLIDLELFCLPQSLSGDFEGYWKKFQKSSGLWTNIRKHLTRSKKPPKKLEYQMANSLEKNLSVFIQRASPEKFTLHDLRHSVATRIVRENAQRHYASKNWTTILATLVDQFGHACVHTLLFTYIGTSVATYSGILPKNTFPIPNQAADHLMKSVTGFLRAQ